MEEMQPFSDRPIGLWMKADEMSLLPQSSVTAGWGLLTEQKETQFQKHKSQQGITGLSLEIHTTFLLLLLYFIIIIFLFFLFIFLQFSHAITLKGRHRGESTENMTLISCPYGRYFQWNRVIIMAMKASLGAGNCWGLSHARAHRLRARLVFRATDKLSPALHSPNVIE